MHKITVNSPSATHRSSFELAASRLGFNGNLNNTCEEEQDALLNILYYAGYLNTHQLREDLDNIGGIESPQAAFEYIHQILIESNATQRDPEKFDAPFLRKNFFGSLVGEQDAMDLLLYIAQHAFNRKVGQERTDLKSYSWMTEYKNEYLKAAEVLGFINRKKPLYENYDIAWVAGKSYPGFLARVVDYFFIISKYNICIKDSTYILTGGHELHVESQGIEHLAITKLLEASIKGEDIDLLDISLTPKKCQNIIEEGRKYISSLAKKFEIKLKHEEPFTVHKSKEECTFGREPNKLYPNYQHTEGLKITESLMAQSVLMELGQEKDVCIISTPIQESGARPTTATTVYDAIQQFIQKIKGGEYGNRKQFSILLQSNQPYVQRQTLTARQEVKKVLREHGLDTKGYEITIDGAGFSCKEEISTIHSSFGALMTEKWRIANAMGIPSKRDIKDLLFQTRRSSANAELHTYN